MQHIHRIAMAALMAMMEDMERGRAIIRSDFRNLRKHEKEIQVVRMLNRFPSV